MQYPPRVSLTKGLNMKEHIKESIESYHSNKEIPSRSSLVMALKSPAHLRKYLDGDMKKTDNMKLGSFIHEFIEYGIRVPQHWSVKTEVYQRATNGRPAGSAKLDENGKPLYSYVNDQNPDESLTPAKSVLATNMMAAIENDIFITRSMELPDMVIEPTFYGEINGMKVKARPDLAYTDGDGHLIEIKTTSSLDESTIAREFFEYGYDIQAFLELKLSGAEAVTFYFVSAEVPSGVARFTMTKEHPWYKLGEHRATEGLRLFYANKDTTQVSYSLGDIEIPLSYKAADYMAQHGIEG